MIYDTRFDVLSSLGFTDAQIASGPNIYLDDLLGYRGDLLNRPYQLGGPVDEDPNWERNKYLLTYLGTIQLDIEVLVLIKQMTISLKLQ